MTPWKLDFTLYLGATITSAIINQNRAPTIWAPNPKGLKTSMRTHEGTAANSTSDDNDFRSSLCCPMSSKFPTVNIYYSCM